MEKIGGVLIGQHTYDRDPIFVRNIWSTKEHELYHTDAPNGIYWVETSGSGGGNIIFVWGRIRSDLKMSYTVQYYVGDEVATKIFESKDVNIKFDGTFRVVKIFRLREYRNRLGETWTEGRRHHRDEPEFIRWRIHLPVEPQFNRTITVVK